MDNNEWNVTQYADNINVAASRLNAVNPIMPDIWTDSQKNLIFWTIDNMYTLYDVTYSIVS